MTAVQWRGMTRVQRADAVRTAIAAGAGSASDIGDRLGVTRNAIIGICTRHDIKLPGQRNSSGTAPRKPAPHPGDIMRKREARKADPGPPRAPERPIEQPPSPVLTSAPFEPKRVPYFDAGHRHCAWLLDETDHLPVEKKLVCGLDREYGADQPYCRHHLIISGGAEARRKWAA